MNGYGQQQNYVPGMAGGPMPNYGSGADPLKLFTQQPHYSPMPMSPGMMSNPLGLAVGLYGVPMMQQLAGPGSFVPNLMQSQGLSDQYTAYQHQRQSMHATFATAKHGQNSLQNLVTGGMSLASGQAPNQLMREHADMAAGVLNDPFAKMFLGGRMGQDTMEQAFYGSKGDPAALSAAVGRAGFYRKDPMGGRRMTGKSLAEMSSNVYEQLYGENADIDDMRGFGAGQAGQMFEQMFQTGRLPQSLGALSAADRVKAVAGGPRDEGTLNRLSEEYSHRELMDSNPEVNGKRYSELTREEQKSEIDRRLPETRNKLNATLAEVDKFNSGAPGSKDAGDIEKLTGFSSMAGNVAASKATGALKEYAGAVKAVQQIFGAAGNPNAPFPALIAVLNQLTAGGSMAMPATKVESNIKQMHNAAKDAGMSVEQMMQVHQIQATTNRAAGIGPEADMSGAASIIRSMKAANEAGEFGMGYGRMSQAEAQQVMAQQNTSGQTSNAGRKMAALARMVDNSPDTMGMDTDAGRLMDAYKKKQTHFTNSKGEKVDIGQALLDPNFVQQVAQSSGANLGDLEAMSLDPVTQQRYGQEMGEYIRTVAQPKQVKTILSNEYGTMLAGQRNNDSAKFQQVQRELGDKLNMGEIDMAMGQAAAESIVEKTTADMSDAQKFDVVSQDMRAAIDKQLEAAGVADPKERERQTEAIFTATMGEKKDQQVQRFGGQFLARGNRVLASMTTGVSTIESAQQLYRKSVTEPVLEERRADEGLAARQIAMDRGHETNVIQRASDELQRIGRGEKTDMQTSIENILNAVPIAEMAEKGAPELVAGLKSASQFGAEGSKLVNAFNTGSAEDIQSAAAMMAKSALGATASQEDIAKFTQTALTGTPEQLTAALESAGVKKEDREKFLTAATGLKTAKDFSFSRLFGENLSPEEFQAHERRMHIRGAAATSAKMDADSRTPDGLQTRVGRTFDMLTRAESPEAKQAAIEELARQSLGKDGTPESIAELSEALATGEAYTPEEMAKRKRQTTYSKLSREDQDAATAASMFQEAAAADNPAAAEFISDEAKAYLAQKERHARGEYDFTPEEEKKTVGAMRGMSDTQRDRIRMLALGVKASTDGPKLNAEQRKAMAISSVIAGRDAAKEMGPEAAAALDSVLNDKGTDNVKQQASTLARSIYGEGATDEQVAALADNIVKAGSGGDDYSAVIDTIDSIHGGDETKRAQAMDSVVGFNAARQVAEKADDFVRFGREEKIHAANTDMAGFGTTAQLGFRNYQQYQTKATKEEFLRLLGQDVGVATTLDGEKQDAFVAAMQSGDKEQIAAATAGLKLSEDKQAQLLRVSQGMQAVEEEGTAQKDAARAAKEAAEATKKVAVDTRARTDYGMGTDSLAEAGQERSYTLDSTMGGPAGMQAGGSFFGTGAETLALGAGATLADQFAQFNASAPVPVQSSGRTGTKNEETKISGTLKLQGLQEVIAELVADNNMEPTPDGAMVDLGNANQAYRGSRPYAIGQA